MGQSHLFDALARLRRRGQARAGAAGLLWCLATLAIAVLIACWLDLAWELSPTARLGALAMALFAGILALIRTLLIELPQSSSERLARRLDVLGGTGGQILAGVDLATARLESLVSPQPALSAGLAT